MIEGRGSHGRWSETPRALLIPLFHVDPLSGLPRELDAPQTHIVEEDAHGPASIIWLSSQLHDHVRGASNHGIRYGLFGPAAATVKPPPVRRRSSFHRVHPPHDLCGVGAFRVHAQPPALNWLCKADEKASGARHLRGHQRRCRSVE